MEATQMDDQFLSTVLDRRGDLHGIVGFDTKDFEAVAAAFAATAGFGVENGVANGRPVAGLIGPYAQFRQFGVGGTAGKGQNEAIRPRVAPDVGVGFQVVGFQIDQPHMDRIGRHQYPRLQRLGLHRPSNGGSG
ncbi:MAG: hypothetical protein ACF8TS_03125 [Maioricimonas sp. JB049]